MSVPRRSKILVLLPILMLLGCSKQHDIRKGVFETVNMKNAPSDLFLPHGLWQKIEVLPKQEGASSPGSSEGSASSLQVDPPGTVSYVPVSVFLMEETPGALKGRNVELQFGKGGGNLDLADFVDSSAKSDFVFGVAVPGLSEASRVQVYFLNNAKPRRIGDEIFGMGCNTYLDLTSYFRSQIAGKGQRITTLRQLYLNLLVGSYVIAYQSEERWYITQLTITDSRFSDHLCRQEMDSSGT